jgi:4-diphosphocytidyl-2-C-methyl-D-erythritol kinase
LPAYAKVNLGLEVTGHRADGHHELRSILTNIDIVDTITLAPGAGTSVIGGEAPAEPLDSTQELATRALERLEAIAGRSLGLGITLRKEIPAGAGLGGGSADAAAVLRAAPLLGLSAGSQRLRDLALELGADVPFQLVGGAALVGGVGEVVEPLPYRELWLAVAFGRVHCSTAEVFGELGRDERSSGGEVEAAAAAWNRDDPSLLDVLDALPNALWAPATRRYPAALEEMADALEEGGWRPRLTGSGSAMYQLCRDGAEAQRLALSASTLGFKAWSCKSVGAPLT